MKRLLLTVSILPLLVGCARLSVTRTSPDGTRVQFEASSLFSNSVLKGVAVENTTKTTSALLKLATSGTEPNAESITASGSALGELIGTAAKTAAKP